MGNGKMRITSPEDLVKLVAYYYKEARKLTIPHPLIKRGRSHNISSVIEDIFSLYLSENIKNISFYVDQPTTILDGKTVYPDILLVDQYNKVTNLIDLKMD